MNKYAFLYKLFDLIPVKTAKIKQFRNLLRFYQRGNTLTILHENGQQTINPLRAPKFLTLRASGKSFRNNVIISDTQKPGFSVGLYFWTACDNTITIGTGNNISMIGYVRGNNGCAHIGNNNHICGAILYMYCSGVTTFTIGNNNLFSEKIVFWAGEGHSIIDASTTQVSNMGGNITIGDNNWICMNVCFLKHAKIGNGCVVGYGSIVSGDLSGENKCIIAGNPGHVVKRDILWSDKEPWNYNGELYI